MPPKQPAILVVEDEESIRKLLMAYLLQAGFQVFLTGNGQEALDVCRDQPIDLALVDVRLPGLDGRATLLALREIRPCIPCCFMSGHPGTHDPSELKAVGGAYLQKPFSLSVLVKTLRDLLTPPGPLSFSLQ